MKNFKAIVEYELELPKKPNSATLPQPSKLERCVEGDDRTLLTDGVPQLCDTISPLPLNLSL